MLQKVEGWLCQRKIVYTRLTMKKHLLSVALFSALVFLCLLTACTNENKHAGKPHIEIPRIDKVPTLDGNSSEWDTHAFTLLLFADQNGIPCQPADIRAVIHLAWTETALYLAVDVADNVLLTGASDCWQNDAVEIYLSPQAGSPHKVGFLMSPANDGQVLLTSFDFREKEQPLVCKSVARITDKGYSIESEILFSGLGIEPKKGEVCGIQILVSDFDRSRTAPESVLSWHYLSDTYRNDYALHNLKLGGAGSHKQVAAAKAWSIDGQFLQINLAVPSDNPPDFSLKISGNVALKGALPVSNDFGFMGLQIPLSTSAKALDIQIGNEKIPRMDIERLPVRYVHLKAPNQYEKTIREFEADDRKAFPKPGAVVFYGSSTIRKWTTLADDFPGIRVLNRGFGGSTALEAAHYAPRVVIPYKPSKVVYYEGDNDIYFGTPPQDVAAQVERFINMVSRELPDAKILILSIKPSKGRMKYWPDMQKANDLIRAICEKHPAAIYIDVAGPMLGPDGTLKDGLIMKDGVHLTEEGYALWVNVLKRYLG